MGPTRSQHALHMMTLVTHNACHTGPAAPSLVLTPYLQIIPNSILPQRTGTEKPHQFRKALHLPGALSGVSQQKQSQEPTKRGRGGTGAGRAFEKVLCSPAGLNSTGTSRLPSSPC